MLLSLLNDPVRVSTEEHLAQLSSFEVPEPPAESAEAILAEIETIRGALGRIRFVISAYPDVLGLLKGGPLMYTLDSSDPEKLKAIVDDMQRRGREPIAKLLPSTLILGKNYATERLASVYQKFELESAGNFVDVDERRAMLYLPALANQDLKPWVEAGAEPEALKLTAFLKAQAEAGRDKVTLLLPKSWAAVAQWTRQAFAGVAVITNEKPNLRNYGKDRVFLVVQRKGEEHPESAAIKALRNARFPMAVLTFNATAPLARYMRFIEAAASPMRRRVEDDRAALAEGILSEGLENNATWKQLHTSPESPKTLANAINYGVKTRAFSRGEIVFFGDLRYSDDGPETRKVLDNGARLLFRSPLKMAGTVCEGPGDVIAGDTDCFSLLILPAVQNRFALAQFEPNRHIAEFLATKAALEKQRRPVRAILVKDFSAESREVLGEFFSQTANSITSEPLSLSQSHGQIQSR